MTLLFDIFRGMYFFLTLLLIMLITRGSALIPTESVSLLQSYIMPAYLVISGVLIGYILSLMHHIPDDVDQSYRQNINSTSYIQGIVIGIMFAMIYIYTI